MTQRKKPLEECRDKELVIAAGMMNKDDRDMKTKPTPKTTEELEDSIGRFYQNGGATDYEAFQALLSDLLCARNLNIAIELLKLKELERISNDIAEIRITLDSMSQFVTGIASAS